MAEIKTSVIINSTQEKIWGVISDIDNEPKFWKGTKEVRNISKEGNNISREIQLHFVIKNVCKRLQLFLKK